MQPRATRRSFLAASSLTAAAASRAVGANDRIRLGVIGTGPRGQYLMREAARGKQAEFAALCDVYSVRRDEAAGIAGGSPKTYSDHRRVLDERGVDAVIVATPDHWHAPITVEACQAGKDVYVEKPMVHRPEDGQAVVRAAREHKRIVEVGMQARAVPHWQQARERVVSSGAIGKVGLARTWYDANSGYIKTAPKGMDRKPEGLDWDRWLGPGPKVAWNPEIYFSPYKWLHYDGGMIMGIGIHVIDIVHQFLGLTKPSAVVAGGGIYLYDDGRDTPDVINLILEYPQKLNLTFEAEIASAGNRTESIAGIELRGTGGVLTVNRYDRQTGWRFVPNPSRSKEPQQQAPGDPANAEWLLADWFECIRTRRRPIADEVAGYYSAVACFMGLEAYRTKSRVPWNPAWDLPV